MGGTSVLRSALTVPLGPNLLSIHRAALKVRPQACLEAVLLEHGSLCTQMRGCAAGLCSPGINGRQLIQEHAMLTVSFPDPSVRCCIGKYCAYQYRKRAWNTSRPNQSWMKRNAATAQTCYATLVLSRDANPSPSETSSDSDVVTALR